MEHSGNSPRSANKDSSSSLIGKNMERLSQSVGLLSAKKGLSKMVEVVVSISPNHVNSSALEVMSVLS